MKKLLLISLLFITTNAFGQLGDYYYSSGHPKTKGLNFQIKPPRGFEQLEGERPNIVQKWSKDKTNNDKFVNVMVLVYNMPDEMKGVSRAKWKQYFKSEQGRADFVSDFEVARNVKYFVLDDYPGIILDTQQEVERMEFSFMTHLKQITIVVEDHIFSLLVSALHENLIEENTELFHLVANSVVFPDQYGN